MELKSFWKSARVNLAVTAIWYAAEYAQFGELKWNRWGDNIVGALYLFILWRVFRHEEKLRGK